MAITSASQADDVGSIPIARSILLFTILVTLSACVPMQPVHRPLPNYIELAIKQGDTVKLVTHDSRNEKFVVTEISDSALIGKDQQIQFVEIEELYVRAKKRPPYPCGGEEPLGCSVPTRGKVVATTAAIFETILSNGPIR